MTSPSFVKQEGQHHHDGIKIREIAPLPRGISLEELVPSDCFYRDLEKGLDLSLYG